MAMSKKSTNYVNTSAIDSAIKKKIKASGSKGVAADAAREEAIRCAQEAGSRMVALLNTAIGGSGLSGKEIGTIGEPSASMGAVTMDGHSARCEVIASIPAQHRDSMPWVSTGNTPYNGVDDMAALFNNGWDASASVYGKWHGKNVWSLTHKDGAHFVENAVDSFGVPADLNVVSVEINERFN